MSTGIRIVLCSCPDPDTAARIARQLLETRLAACVNLVPGLTSLYHWQGTLESAQETLLLIKTTEACYPSLETLILKHHPYELPEILAIPIEQGLSAYLEWVRQCVKPG